MNIWKLIEDLETREQASSLPFSELLHEARCAERMAAWEKLIWWYVSGKDFN